MDNCGVGLPTNYMHLRSKYLHCPLSIIHYPLKNGKELGSLPF